VIGYIRLVFVLMALPGFLDSFKTAGEVVVVIGQHLVNLLGQASACWESPSSKPVPSERGWRSKSLMAVCKIPTPGLGDLVILRADAPRP
jgi:hypothetical protein